MSINSFPNGTVDRSIGRSGTRATHGISFARSRDREKRRSQLLLGAAVIPRSSEEHGVIVVENVSAGSNRSGLLASRSRLIMVYFSANRDCIRLHSHANVRMLSVRRSINYYQIARYWIRYIIDIGVRYDIQFDFIRASYL